MSRTKKIIDETLLKQAETVLKTIKDSDVILKLLAIINYQNHSGEEVAKFLNIKQRSIFRWIQKFKEFGIDGLKAQGKGRPASLLNQEQKKQVELWITSRKDHQGKDVNWTLSKLSKTIEEYYGVKIRKSALAVNLKKLGIVRRRSRPIHHKSDKEKQSDFKKN